MNLLLSIQTSLRKKTDSCGLMSGLSKGTKNMIIPSSSRRPFGAWFITFTSETFNLWCMYEFTPQARYGSSCSMHISMESITRNHTTQSFPVFTQMEVQRKKGLKSCRHAAKGDFFSFFTFVFPVCELVTMYKIIEEPIFFSGYNWI